MTQDSTLFNSCDVCGRSANAGRLFIIDGTPLCNICLFGPVDPVSIYPIGIVENSLSRNESDFGLSGEDMRSRIILHSAQKRFMYRLEQEKELTIIYYLHQSRPVRSRFQRGFDGKETGVFASRTPDRLSRIAIQDVRLLSIEGTTLTVEGLDAVNGSPVLDIKMKKPQR